MATGTREMADEKGEPPQLQVTRHGSVTKLCLVGSTDGPLALHLGSVLDDLCDRRVAAVVDARQAELSFLAWVVLERAVSRFQRVHVPFRLDPPPEAEADEELHDARLWLDVLRDSLTHSVRCPAQ